MVKRRIIIVAAFSIMSMLALVLRVGLIKAITSSHEELASNFLRDVAGFNMNNYSITHFSEFTMRESVYSQYFDTIIDSEITGNDTQLDARIELSARADGKMDWYSLDGTFGAGELNDSELLIKATNYLNAYQAFSNASYCGEFVKLLSMAIQTQTSQVEDENFSLRLSSMGEGRFALDVDYNLKVNGYPVNPGGGCFSISVSRNGLLSSLMDNMMVYHVATKTVNITRDEAIALSTPNATVYANKFGQAITVTNATFDYTMDLNSFRGDKFAIYPRWSISFTFDKVNDEFVSGYVVWIWADTGQVYYSQPQVWITGSDDISVSVLWQIVAFATSLIVLFGIVVTYVRCRARARKSSNLSINKEKGMTLSSFY